MANMRKETQGPLVQTYTEATDGQGVLTDIILPGTKLVARIKDTIVPQSTELMIKKETEDQRVLIDQSLPETKYVGKIWKEISHPQLEVATGRRVPVDILQPGTELMVTEKKEAEGPRARPDIIHLRIVIAMTKKETLSPTLDQNLLDTK